MAGLPAQQHKRYTTTTTSRVGSQCCSRRMLLPLPPSPPPPQLTSKLCLSAACVLLLLWLFLPPYTHSSNVAEVLVPGATIMLMLAAWFISYADAAVWAPMAVVLLAAAAAADRWQGRGSSTRAHASVSSSPEQTLELIKSRRSVFPKDFSGGCCQLRERLHRCECVSLLPFQLAASRCCHCVAQLECPHPSPSLHMIHHS